MAVERPLCRSSIAPGVRRGPDRRAQQVVVGRVGSHERREPDQQQTGCKPLRRPTMASEKLEHSKSESNRPVVGGQGRKHNGAKRAVPAGNAPQARRLQPGPGDSPADRSQTEGSTCVATSGGFGLQPHSGRFPRHTPSDALQKSEMRLISIAKMPMISRTALASSHTIRRLAPSPAPWGGPSNVARVRKLVLSASDFV